VQAVIGAKAEEHGLAAEEDNGELCVGVFEGEVEVAGGGGAVVRDLAFNPDVAVLLLDEFADLGDQLADRPDAAGGARIVERKSELGLEWILEAIA